MLTPTKPFRLPRSQKLYAQLADQLRESIIDGKFAVGEMLPSENEMATLYEVSRITVRQAISLLVEEGLVNRIQGKGTFVQALSIEQNFLGLHDFARELQAQGREPGFCILGYELVAPAEHFRSLFKLSPEEKMHSIRRIKHSSGVPIMLERILLPASRFPDLPRDELETKWLSEILATRYQCPLKRVRKSLQPIMIGPAEAEKLGVAPRSLGLLVDRVTWQSKADETPVMYTRSIVPAEHSRFYVDLEYDQIQKDF